MNFIDFFRDAVNTLTEDARASTSAYSTRIHTFPTSRCKALSTTVDIGRTGVMLVVNGWLGRECLLCATEVELVLECVAKSLFERTHYE
jgi:hypothetical protein